MSDTEHHAGRRSYDREIDPVIENFIEARITDTRHLLRNEFSVAMLNLSNKISELSAAVAASTLQSTKEHAEVHAGLDELRREILGVKETAHPLVARVVELERHDDLGEARQETRDALLASLEKGRRWMIGTAIALAALIVSVAAAVIAVV